MDDCPLKHVCMAPRVCDEEGECVEAKRRASIIGRIQETPIIRPAPPRASWPGFEFAFKVLCIIAGLLFLGALFIIIHFFYLKYTGEIS